MIRLQNALLVFVLPHLFSQLSHAQEAVVPKLIWDVNKVVLGTVMEEEGIQYADFNFIHTQDSLFYIENVWTDCGCTTVEYSDDTLSVGEEGHIKVAFDPSSSAGYFSKRIIVTGNLAGTVDTLFVEGTAIPRSGNPEIAYGERKGNIGFRLPKVNMGEVFMNGPKIKEVEIFNFGDIPLAKDSLEYAGPAYIQVTQLTPFIMPNDRGLLQFVYDGNKKNDLGYFEDKIQLFWRDSTLISLDVLADVFEFYAPFAREDLHLVPQLVIGVKEIDFKTIHSNEPQVEFVTLNNQGKQVLEIKKVQGNCECLTLELLKTTIEPGETVQLKVIFDPKGRKGIDQRNIYVFSNDPLNPVQLFILKSRIE